MRVSIFGLGYVGSVSAGCLGDSGHSVIGVDVSPMKVELIRAGKSPVLEPQLADMLSRAQQAGKLAATLDPAEAVMNTDVSLITVGTPGNGNGKLSLRFVSTVCEQIGSALQYKPGYHLVVIRSTVVPGTVLSDLLPILMLHSGKQPGRDFGLCMNPEFLREGTAVSDYRYPSQIVIGEMDRRSGDMLAELYSGVDAPVVRTTIPVAETVKYVNNAFHALKVAFANEIGSLCKSLGVDGQEVMDIFCQDTTLNISARYLKPGFGFGGSCLPKDMRALLYKAKENDVDCPVLAAVMSSNQKQIQRGIELVESTGRKKIGVLGLSFKAGTDDVRESPTVTLVETLVGRGYHVGVYDDCVDPARLIGANKMFLERELPHVASLMRGTIEELVAESEVLVVANGSPAFHRVPQLLQDNQIMIDLVGIRNGHPAPQGTYQGICW